jgi:hypothetical protein
MSGCPIWDSFCPIWDSCSHTIRLNRSASFASLSLNVALTQHLAAVRGPFPIRPDLREWVRVLPGQAPRGAPLPEFHSSSTQPGLQNARRTRRVFRSPEE